MLDFILRMYRAKPVDPQKSPGLHAAYEDLCRRAKIKNPPTLRTTKLGMPNAAFLPFNNSIVLSDEIIHLMESSDHTIAPKKELEAVIAHELGHARFKWRQFAPPMAIGASIGLAAMVGTYLLDKTYDRMKEQGKDPADKKGFGETFSEVAREAKNNPLHALNHTLQRAYAIPSKMFGLSYYKDKGWGRAFTDNVITVGVNLATIVVTGKFVHRPFSLRNEWEADRFMLALTKDKDACHSAFSKLEGAYHDKLKGMAKTHVQKGFADKMADAMRNFIKNNMMAHPETAERLEHIRLADVGKLTSRYHL